MANPIENKQIVEALTEIKKLGEAIEKTFKGVAENAQKFGKEAEKAVKNLDLSKTKDIEDLNKIMSELTKETDNLTKANKNRAKASEQLTKQEKTLLKLQEEQKDTTDELTVQIEELRLQRNNARKAAKEEARENQGLTNTYDRQRKRLSELTNSLINLRLEGDKNSQTLLDQQAEFEELNKSIREAEEEFGRFQRSVGEYPRDAQRATRATERLNDALNRVRNATLALGAATATGGVLSRGFKSTQDGADQLSGAIDGVNATFDNFLSTIASSTLTGPQSLEEIINDQAGAFTLFDRVVSGVTDGVKQSQDVFNAVSKRVKEINDLNRRLLDNLDKDGKTTIDGLISSSEKLGLQLDLLTEQAGQNNRSLEDRLKIIEEAQKTEKEFFKSQEEIANERINIFQKELKTLNEVGAGFQQILQARQNLTDANAELLRIQGEQQSVQLQLAEERVDILSDQTELELDILIDSFDTTRTLNERLINDERKTFEERKKILNETLELSQQSFDAQIDAIVELQRARNLDGFDEVEFRKQILNFVKAEATAQKDLRKELDLSEKISIRALEVSRERRIVNQENLEIEKELAQSRIDADLQAANIKAQEKALERLRNNAASREKIESDLSNDINKNEIDALQKRLDEITKFRDEQKKLSEETRKRIEDDNRILKSEIKEFTEDLNSEDEFLNREAQQKLIDERKRTLEENKKILEEQVENLEKSSQEELDIREKLNDKLIANEKKKSDEIKNAQEQALRDLVSSAQFASQVFENISSSRIAQIDSEIDAISRREDQLRDAFNNAPQLAQKSLTELDNQRQELEDRRAEELERQARRELLVAGAQVLAQSGSIQEAANNLLQLKGLVSGLLVGFHDGGYTGNKGEYEIAGVTHGQEFVNTKKQVDEYDMHGWTASDFDAAVKSGHFQQFTDPKYLTYQPIPINNGSTRDNSIVVDRLEKVEKAIYSTIDYSPQHDLRWIEQNKEMEYIIKTKHKTDRLRRKSIRY